MEFEVEFFLRGVDCDTQIYKKKLNLFLSSFVLCAIGVWSSWRRISQLNDSILAYIRWGQELRGENGLLAVDSTSRALEAPSPSNPSRPSPTPHLQPPLSPLQPTPLSHPFAAAPSSPSSCPHPKPSPPIPLLQGAATPSLGSLLGLCKSPLED
jgi:hypothetical protein